MLHIKNLSVCVENKEILHNITFSFQKGKVYFLLGQNGSGKSSLAFTLAGHPKYNVQEGEIFLEEQSLLSLAPDERNNEGLFLSFQQPYVLSGVKTFDFLRHIYLAHLQKQQKDIKLPSPLVFKKFLQPLLQKCGFDNSLLDRDVNSGLSGGEKKRFELLQALLLKPKILLLDEIDAGLDRDALLQVGEILSTFKNEDTTLIVITHNFSLQQFLPPDEVIVLKDGKIEQIGGIQILEMVEKKGYN